MRQKPASFTTFAAMKRAIIALLMLWMAGMQAGAAGEDSLRISLLTCGAGDEIYSLFGHTALRVEDRTTGRDVVYHYGVFDFDTPNFALKFALGETDYQMGMTSYKRFLSEYAWLGRSVEQQVLDLTPEEARRLDDRLAENYRPENRVYRYSYFYDNCATRPRDQVEQAVEGHVDYGRDMESRATGQTFRSIMRHYAEGHPWSRFGMDFCLGSKADEPVNLRETMFVPFNVRDYFATAQIAAPDGTTRPLTRPTETLVPSPDTRTPQEDQGFTPLRAALLLFAATAGATIYGLKRKRPLWGIDAVLFAAAGLAGIIPAFLVLFSQHPAVSPNYLLLVFHPLHLLCLPWMLRRVSQCRRSRYMAANFTVLTLFILLWAVIPQRFDLAVLPLACCLLVRSGSNLVLSCRKQN